MNETPPLRSATRRTTHFINGTWTPEGPTFPDYNPFNGELVAEIAAGGRAEAEAAVAAAAAAFPAWSALPPAERQRLFLKAADITERRLDDIVATMAVENGSSKTFAAFQIRLSAAMLRQAASYGYMPYGDMIRSDVPGRTALVARKPLGVVAGFTPWNGAFYLAWARLPAADGVRQHHRHQAFGRGAYERRPDPCRDPGGSGFPGRQLQRRHPCARPGGGDRGRVLREQGGALHQLHRLGQDRAYAG